MGSKNIFWLTLCSQAFGRARRKTENPGLPGTNKGCQFFPHDFFEFFLVSPDNPPRGGQKIFFGSLCARKRLGVLAEKPQIQGCQAQTRVASIFHMTFLKKCWHPLITLPEGVKKCFMAHFVLASIWRGPNFLLNCSIFHFGPTGQIHFLRNLNISRFTILPCTLRGEVQARANG